MSFSKQLATAILISLLSIFSFVAVTQADVIIDTEAFYTGNYQIGCSTPYSDYFTVRGDVTGNTANSDSLLIEIDYGDGTTDQRNISFISNSFYESFNHTYSSQGSYTITTTVTASNGDSDTRVENDAVIIGSNCDSIKGNVYQDPNQNCVFDPNENAWEGSVRILHNGNEYETDYTNPSNVGYGISVVPGYSYEVALRLRDEAPVCPVSGQHTVTSVPSSSNDFYVKGGVTLQDTASTLGGNYCAPPAAHEILVYIWDAGNLKASNDTVDISVNFGDGSADTTVQIHVDSLLHSVPEFVIPHTYQNSGQYRPVITALHESGATDTLVSDDLVTVGDSCGNISGTAYIDQNNNCNYNSNEQVREGLIVELYRNNNFVERDWTDSSGRYSFDVPSGFSYDIIIPDSNSFLNVCPSSVSVSSMPAVNHIGISCDTSYDISSNVSGWRFRPGFTGYLNPSIYNGHECQSLTCTFKLQLGPNVYFDSSRIQPTSQSGKTLIWQQQTVQPSDYFYPSVDVIVDTQATTSDSVCVQWIRCPQDSSHFQAKEYCFPIRNSWDPNNKLVNPSRGDGTNKVAPGEQLKYTVNFQNTGNAKAFNVSILDTLDPKLDVSSINVLSTSHDMNVYFPDTNVIKFSFPDIMLPDSNSNEPESHGHVTYSIEQEGQLPLGTEIRNNAGIYFDFNPVVMTNEVRSVVDTTTSIREVKQDQSGIEVYPNPASNQLNIHLDDNADRLTLYNLTGQKVYQKRHVQKGTVSMDVGDLNAGVYLLRVEGGEQAAHQKVVISE